MEEGLQGRVGFEGVGGYVGRAHYVWREGIRFDAIGEPEALEPEDARSFCAVGCKIGGPLTGWH